MNQQHRRHLLSAAFAAALLSLSAASAAAQDSDDAANGVVNIQTASADQLQLLPGIGPGKAQAIVAYRERHAFRRVEDIMRVRGVGRSTFRRLRPMLTVDGPTTMTAPTRASRRASAPAHE